MTAAREGLLGAWLLLLRDRAAIARFDDTPAAAIQSFRAAAVALPFHLGWLILGPDTMASSRPLLATLLLHAEFYVIIWTAWPAIAWNIFRRLGSGAHYCRYLSAYNWSMAIQSMIWLAVGLILVFGGLSDGAARWLGIFAVALILLYHSFILAEALAIRPFLALAFALLKFVIYQIVLGVYHAALVGAGQ